MNEQEIKTGPPAAPVEPSAAPSTGLKTYTVAEKLAHMRAYDVWEGAMEAFCAQAGVTSASLCKWRRQYATLGEAGLAPQENPRNAAGTSRRAYTPEERRAAVEAWQKSGMAVYDFAKVWGVGTTSLSVWARQYAAKGPKALEHPLTGTGPRGRKGLAAGLKAAIVGTRRQFPGFGLKKVRDHLWRFGGLKVSIGSVRKTLRAAGIPREAARKRYRGRSEAVRAFERAKPNELWQSDITSYVLTRSGQRVYLTVFLDDYSRYVVSWGLAMQQKQELVTGALLEGIQRFGKPLEVLTDQGRQYCNWRGKSDFQKLLARQGIRHVVARTHHPQTVGKCERLWETVGNELWARVQPQELGEAQARLAHFFAHYNHFRPHQGIGGMVPADRLFGVESQVRKALEATLAANELALALDEAPRRPVFLVGQIGDQPISLVGDRGTLRVQTPGGGMTELIYDAHNGAGFPQEGKDGGRNGTEDGRGNGSEAERGTEAAAAAGEDRAAAEAACAGAGIVGGGEPGGAAACAGSGDGAAGDLAGTDQPGGGGEAAGADAGAFVAAEPVGDERAGGGAVEAAEGAEGSGGGADGAVGSGSEGAGEAGGGAGAGDGGAAGADRAAADAADEPGGGAGQEAGEEKSGASAASSAGSSESGWGAGAGSGELNGESSPGSVG
jgi:transposase InsO family protein/transposase-like protein